MRFGLMFRSVLFAVSGLSVAAFAGDPDAPVIQLPGYKIEALVEVSEATTMTETCDQAFGWSIYLADAETGEMRIVNLNASGVDSFPVDELLPGEGPFWPAYDSQGYYTHEKDEQGTRIYVLADRFEVDFDDLLQIDSAQNTYDYLSGVIAVSDSLAIDQLGWFNHRMFWICGHVHPPEMEGGVQGEGGVQCELNHALRRYEPTGEIVDVALVDENCTQMHFTDDGNFGESLFIANPSSGLIYRIDYNHVDGDPPQIWSTLDGSSSKSPRPVGLALPTATGWPEDRMFVTEADTESIVLVDSDGYVADTFATNVRSEGSTLLWGTCGLMTDKMYLLTNGWLWEISLDEAPDEYYLPKRVRVRPKVNSKKLATMQTRGTMEVGSEMDIGKGAVIRIGDYTITVPPGAANDGKYVVNEEDYRVRVKMAHEGGSKMRFRVDVEDDDMLETIPCDGLMPVRITTPDDDVDAGAVIVMEDCWFQIGKKSGELLDPDLYFYRVRGKYKGPGKDTLQLRFGIGEHSEMAEGAVDDIGDVTLNLNDEIVVTIPGDAFENKNGKYVFTGDPGGVKTKIIYDTNKERMIAYVRKIDLPDYPEGQVDWDVELTVGSVTTSFNATLVREGDQLRY